MKKTKTIATIALALLLTISALMVIAPTNNVDAQDDYGDPLQYEWGQRTGFSSSNTHFSDGPAPAAPNLLWKFKEYGGSVTAFDGKVFVRRSGGRPGTVAPPPKFWALDPFTGEVIWETEEFTGAAVKLDETRMLIGRNCVETATGNLIWTAPSGFNTRPYAPDIKMSFSGLTAWDMNDLSQPPTLAWERPDLRQPKTSYFEYGDGKYFISGIGYERALNATTGEIIWTTELTSNTDYNGCYYQGKLYRASLDGNFYCLDADTGEVLWIYNPGTFWNYWASGMAAGYGKVYMYNADTHLYAIDAETGEMVWRYKGPGHDYPGFPVVGGGMVYMTTGNSGYRDPITGEPGINEYTCVDAETGKLVWKLPITACTGHSDLHAIAFGNLYVSPIGSNELWCYGNKPKDWPMFRGDAVHTAEGSGPENLILKWKFQTGGMVISSPSIVDGVAYVGSQDKNIYALDADTGSKIWNFTTEYRVRASPAVVNGKVYTGADDGNVCLDADDGEQLWKTPAGGIITPAQGARPLVRSSPAVVGSRVYVGSLDSNLYCLDANTGRTIWFYATLGPVTSSPAVVDGAVYITSSTPRPSGTLYKLSADTGAQIWNQSIPYMRGPDMHASPTVADGMVFIPADAGSH